MLEASRFEKTRLRRILTFRMNQRPHMTLHVSGQTAPVIAALIAEIRKPNANVPVCRFPID